MRTLDEIRAGLANGATAAEAAKRAKDIASNASAETLLEIVAMLADAVITPPKRGRGGQPKPPPDVTERTNGHIALSEYARLVNSRDILDGYVPRFPDYAQGMDAASARLHLLKWEQPITSGRQGCERKYGDKVRKRYKLKPDAWEQLKGSKLKKSKTQKLSTN